MEIKGKSFSTWLIVLLSLVVVALVFILAALVACAIPFAAIIVLVNMATHRGHIQFTAPPAPRRPRPVADSRIKI